MTRSFRQLVQRLAVLTLIASLAFSFGSLAPSSAFAQEDDLTADTEDTSDGGDDTADLTNETSDDGDSDTADLTNETGDDGDTADLTNETGDLTDVEDSADDLTDVEDSADDLTDVEDSADGGDLTDVQDSNDDSVEELPTTGQGSSQQGRGLELSILASVLLLVAGAFFWTRRTHRI